MLFTAVDRRQVDLGAFVVIKPDHEVLGEGFKPLTRAQKARPN
jgi:hypothetical protein